MFVAAHAGGLVHHLSHSRQHAMEAHRSVVGMVDGTPATGGGATGTRHMNVLDRVGSVPGVPAR